ncbi:MAG: hypothetical protein MZV64_74250 [Ignavibacteriales bacterium]|nr:hypothetical protein [Ignavibacteriales bacterium]
MRSVLSSEGYDGRRGRERRGSPRGRLTELPFDIVITDIYMPVMDGIKFNRAARSDAGLRAGPLPLRLRVRRPAYAGGGEGPPLRRIPPGRPGRWRSCWSGSNT